jgi:hypothetical protein
MDIGTSSAGKAYENPAHEAAQNLRTASDSAAPPLAAMFDTATVVTRDISAKGARFRHAQPVDTG